MSWNSSKIYVLISILLSINVSISNAPQENITLIVVFILASTSTWEIANTGLTAFSPIQSRDKLFDPSHLKRLAANFITKITALKVTSANTRII
jgi:hypothetical protein